MQFLKEADKGSSVTPHTEIQNPKVGLYRNPIPKWASLTLLLGLLGQSTVQEGLSTELDQASSNVNLSLAIVDGVGSVAHGMICLCNKPQLVSLLEHAEALGGWTLLPLGCCAPTRNHLAPWIWTGGEVRPS